MTNANLQELINKAKAGTATPEDFRVLAGMVHADESGALAEQIHKELVTVEDVVFDQQKWERVANEILTTDRSDHIVRPIFIRRWWKWAAAAAAVVLLGAITYLMIGQRNGASRPVTASTADIAPGREGAILTLADNTQLSLDSLGDARIPSQQGSRIVLQKGRLAYEPEDEYSLEVAYNKVSTPRGRQFHVTLPDGTDVWLNAASSLRYPTRFSGTERRVELTGEAYFSVTRNALMPFKVAVNNKAEVQVLGTAFNVSAYNNDPALHTTLIEGRVRVKALQGKGEAPVLQPGQEAIVQQSSAEIVEVRNANVDKAIAWRKGLFNFEGATLEEAMKQLERWYDIEVVYENQPPAIRFVGEIQKNISLKDVLDILAKTKVHFRLENGRKLIVTQ